VTTMKVPAYSARRPIRQHRVASLVLVLMLTATKLATASPTPSRVDPVQVIGSRDAMLHYRQGIEQYDAGAFAASLLSFERAYALSERHDLLFNIGQVQYVLHQFARARGSLEQYLKEGGAHIPETRATEVRRQLAELTRLTGVLRLHLDALPVEIHIQDQHLNPERLRLQVIVDTGVVHITARRERRPVVEREVVVGGGQVVDIAIQFNEAIVDEAPVADTAAVHDRASAFPAPALSWTVAGVAGIGGVATGLATMLTSRHYDELRSRPLGTSGEGARARLDRQRQLVRTLAITSDSLMLAALLAAGIGTYLELTEPAGEHPSALVLGPAGVALLGQF
jgi:hypothetical protein